MSILGMITTRVIAGLKLTADTAAKVGMRLGMNKVPSVGDVIAAARANPLTAGLVIAEVYGVASQEYADFLREHEALRDQLELFNFQVDEISTFTSDNVGGMREEFNVITRAVNAIGSFDDLLALRQAMNLSQAHFKLYAEVSSLGRSLVRT